MYASDNRLCIGIFTKKGKIREFLLSEQGLGGEGLSLQWVLSTSGDQPGCLQLHMATVPTVYCGLKLMETVL